MHQAPPPAFLKQVIKQQNKAPEIEPGNQRDKILSELADSEAWAAVKKFIEAKQVMLAQQLRESVGDVSVEETGFRFLVTDQVSAALQQVISFVEAPQKIYGLKREQDLRNKETEAKK